MSTIKTNQLAHTANGAAIYTLPQTDGSAGQVLTTNGSGVLSWANDSAGKILQVVSTTKTDTFSVTSNGTEQEVTNLNATITPTSNTRKILITISLTYSANGTTYKGRIKRDSTAILQGDASGGKQQASFGLGFTGDENQADVASFTGLDTPGDTNAHTYKVFVINDNSLNIFINRSRQDHNDNRGGRHVSTVTLMEIAA